MTSYKIAITGASGYIGSCFYDFLNAQGHSVYEMGRQLTKPDTKKFIKFTLGGENNYYPLQDIDILIHCAYDFSLTCPEKINAVNVVGSIELLRQAKAQGVKKIIFLSSISSFEGAISYYGNAKYTVEKFAEQLNIIVVKPGLVFSKICGGIVGALNRLSSKLPVLPMIGKGNQCFFPCHINDLTMMINYLVQQEIQPLRPIVAASEKMITFKDIILTLAQYHQKKIFLLPVPYEIFYLGLRAAEVLHLKLGLRSDSLKYLKHYDKAPDFSETTKFNISFRPFNVKTLADDVT